MAKDIIIRKIHYSDRIPIIEYTQYGDIDDRIIELDASKKKEKQYATPDFNDAWEGLVPHFLHICELPKTWDIPGTENGERRSQIDIRSVSFSFEKETDATGVIISGTRRLAHSNRPLNISSPLKYAPSIPYDELQGDADQYLSKACMDQLEKVVEESILYIKGKRAGDNQIDAFNEPVADSEVTEDEDVQPPAKKSKSAAKGKRKH